MKEVERVGLLKMDFLGPEHADADPATRSPRSSAPKASTSTSTPSRSTTRRPTSCSADGQTYGVFQFESSGMRELLRKAKPRAPRRPDRAQRALPARPAQGRDGGRLHLAQAGRRPRSSTSCRSSSRSSPTPTASSPTRNRSCASPRSWPASRMGQSDVLRKAMGKKDPKVMAKQREAFMEGARAQGRQREEGHEDLRPDGVLRRLRLQQVALDGLRVARVPDGVPEGELPAALHGGAADDRSGEHRQARDVPRRVPRAAASPCCRPTSTRASCTFTVVPEGVRFGLARDQERRRGRDPVDASTCASELGRITSLLSRSARSSTCAW